MLDLFIGGKTGLRYLVQNERQHHSQNENLLLHQKISTSKELNKSQLEYMRLDEGIYTYIFLFQESISPFPTQKIQSVHSPQKRIKQISSPHPQY